MKIKALVPFSGVLTMAPGEIREYNNKEVIADLLRAGYIEEVAASLKKSSKKSKAEPEPDPVPEPVPETKPEPGEAVNASENQ